MEEENKTPETIDEIMAEDEEQDELGITDKLVGVLTEPSTLFSKLAKSTPNNMDWFIPLLVVIILGIASLFISMSNPEVRASATEKQMEMIEKNFQEAVDNGQMTQAQADEQLDRIQEQIENAGSGQLIMQAVGIFIFIFIMFFIIAGVFHLFAKSALSGDGTYKHAMVAYGLPSYITALQIIVMIVLTIFFGRMFMDTSVGSFLEMDKSTFIGMILHKLDIFSIWFYFAVSVGFAKMYKSENIGKYLAMVFGLWIGFSVLMFFLAKALPFLRWFGA